MTILEQLIEKQVAGSMMNVLGRTTDQIAEEMTKEILKDKEFMNRMLALIKKVFENTLNDLNRESENGRS